MTKVGQGLCTRVVGIIPTRDRSQGRIRNRTDQPGKIFSVVNAGKARENSSIPHDQPRASSHINDNQCVIQLQAGLLAGSSTKETMNTFSNVESNVVHPVHTAPGHSQKNEISPGAAVFTKELQKKQIKIYERCFLCHSIVLCKTCNKCSQCCHKSACWGQTSKLLEKLAGSGHRSESGSNPQRGLHPPLSDPAELDKVPHSHKLQWQSSQEPQPVGGITSAYGQKCNRTVTQAKFTRVFQPTVFSPKTQQQVETCTRPEQSEPLPQGGEI